jgi:anaerobic magnesium-protoporphyrin IX monomethyl ester cyclase
MNILLMAMPDICIGYPTQMLTTPHLGLSSLAANLDDRHQVRIADLVLKRKNVKKAVEQALERAKPDLVGLSAMTFQYKTALKLAAFIKKRNPAIKVALGGYHATLMYEEIAESPDADHFDFIFRGEADLSFNETVDALEKGSDLSVVDGLSFKRNGEFIHNKKRELEDLSRIKIPERKVRLWNSFSVLKVPWDMIEFSRGCLMSCNFCNIRNMYGRSFRTYDVQRVMEDIASAKKTGIKMLFFVDDNITMDFKRLDSLCDAIIQSGHDDLVYGVQASAIGIGSSEKLVEKMARAGFKQVFLGIENPSRKNLEQLNKGDIVEKSIRAVQHLKDNGFIISSGFIIGTPEDNYREIEDTFRFAKELGTDFPAVQILVPYPKTEIRHRLLDQGLIADLDHFERYDGGYPIVRTKYLSEKDLFSARYRLTRKYLKPRALSVFKVLLRYKNRSIPFVWGATGLIPKVVNSLVVENTKRLFLNEEQMIDRYMNKVLHLNQFNIGDVP